jgi:hypothetical protein
LVGPNATQAPGAKAEASRGAPLEEPPEELVVGATPQPNATIPTTNMAGRARDQWVAVSAGFDNYINYVNDLGRPLPRQPK